MPDKTDETDEGWSNGQSFDLIVFDEAEFVFKEAESLEGERMDYRHWLPYNPDELPEMTQQEAQERVYSEGFVFPHRSSCKQQLQGDLLCQQKMQ